MGPEAAMTAALLGALALCSARFTLPLGAGAYCAVTVTAPGTIAVVDAQLVSGSGRNVSTWHAGYYCAPGVCQADTLASAEAFSDDRRAHRCRVLVDPADANLEATASVHVDGVAYDLGALEPCSVPRRLRFCPAP
jgi:hypothetical protein